MATQRSAVSRRAVLRGTVAAGVAGALTAGARSPARAADRERVAVFGGGVAGLTAAHELSERGFQVTVYERRALGGKARSIPVPGTAAAGRPELPGEHGFRFFPGFYRHIPDTMRRIPFGANPNGVWDNLVPVSEVRFSRRDADDFRIPLRSGGFTTTPEAFRETVGAGIATALRMPPTEGMFFADRLLVFNSSCDARRFAQWERTSWRDFVAGHERSHEFRALLSRTLTSIMVAAKEELASTRTIGNMGEQFLGNPLEIGNDGGLDRVLNGPTNRAWLDPWVARLRELGVRFVLDTEVRALRAAGGRIAGATVADRSGVESAVEADYFVLALPAERARTLWTPEILSARPELAAMDRLTFDWMNGIQFYLREPLDIARGHTAYIDAPWSLTSISQNQMWTTKLTEFGDGAVRDCLSVDISDWNTPGPLYGKPAKECTPEEIAREVWTQLSAHLNDRGELLRAADLHSWFLDPGISWHDEARRTDNADPLLINTAGSWECRPQAHGGLENLFLAGDYVRTNVDLATMEGANESARAAVNALLDVAGSDAPRCRLFTLYRAPELEPLRRIDADRFAAGQPNMFELRA
ncbi:FAD-dependent oxidoreductase [Nocardia panacis]|uniref:FAD-dependent oxidoreductase n=1 Tax=Nocardia panacis TaxID=2340916 RepID=A0A3A4L5S5_9NOCA|nr:FAD-dependent oxidoreductase [Nocardia panacis]RJO77971.1 FAD-dependent oxidoreductase [Nocardia panacis]